MKKSYIVLFAIFVNSVFFSCTQPSLGDEDVIQTEIAECCDEDGEILPPHLHLHHLKPQLDLVINVIKK